MNQPENIFERLIAPISSGDFFERYWDRDILFISRNDLEYHNSILTLSQMDEFLSRNDLRYPTIKMAKDGTEVPLTDYSSILRFGNYSAEGLIEIDRLFDCFNSGATIIHQLMKYSVPSLTKFTNELEQLFGFRFETTVYLTPETSQGFTAHYDTHSVFVIQIFGSKTWRLYDNVNNLPLLNDTFKKENYKETPPTQTIKLLPGDLLYVPRGVAHDAITTDGISLHITLGLLPLLWVDLLRLRIGELKSKADYRKAPLDYLIGDTDSVNEAYRSRVIELVDDLNIERLSEIHSKKILGQHLPDLQKDWKNTLPVT